MSALVILELLIDLNLEEIQAFSVFAMFQRRF
jgi:hypothetical protein